MDKDNKSDIFKTHIEDEFEFNKKLSTPQDNDEENKEKSKPKFIRILFLIFTCLILLFLLLVIYNKNQLKNTTVYTGHSVDVIEDIQTTNNNENIQGFITLSKETPPIFFAKGSNDEFYKTHGLDREPSSEGSAFLKHNASETDRNFILYGKSEATNSPFYFMQNYLDPNYFENNPYIYLSTENSNYKFQTFSFYETIEPINIIQTEFIDLNSFYVTVTNYIHKSIHPSLIDDTNLPSDPYMLTLVGLSEDGNPKYILHSILIESEKNK